jgi:hypothetical protein
MPGKRRDGQLCLRGMASIRPRKQSAEIEVQEQRAFFVWLRLHSRQFPELRWVHAIPNGLWLEPKRGAEAVELGLTAGVWDVFVPMSSSGCNGLYIELKAGRNRLTTEQVAFRAALEPLGFRFVVCRNWLEASETVCEYLDLKELGGR